jgi:phosphate transport system protein
MYTSLFRELLTYMIEDARNITACTHLLFMAKNLERIGDHTTNIAETLYFLVHGKPLAQIRPKRDRSILAEAPEPGSGQEGAA